MKKTILIFVSFLTCFGNSFGQTKADNDNQPFIEVTGTAEKEVIPDEIFIKIILKEKYISREKVTIEMFEEKLIASLKEIGVDPGNLSLTDANADYVKVRWQTKDVLTRKDYSLKISSALILSKVFQQLSKLEIDDADVYKVSYSKIDSLNKSVRIAAIKNAKDRADYLLAAIGEQLGKPLKIMESNSNPPINMYDNVAKSNDFVSYQVPLINSVDKTNDVIQFRKIKVNKNIYVKFLIK